MRLDEILTVAARKSLVHADIEALLAGKKQPTAAALDDFALELARKYLSGVTSFAAADALANSMFGYAAQTGTVGDTLHGVFLAFDAGEFIPHGDDPNADAQEKYTRPQLRKILAEAGAA